jgi:hypothetical protein
MSSVAMANTVVPTPHDVVRCYVNGNPNDALIFAYDANGEMPANAPSRPGFCKLVNDAHGNPYGSYFCWVASTQAAMTTDGQLAIEFADNMGDGEYLYTQINIPALSGVEFAGTERLLNRPAKDLRVPIAPRDARKMDCRAEALIFQDIR